MFKRQPDFAPGELPEPVTTMDFLRFPRLRRQLVTSGLFKVVMLMSLLIGAHFTDTTGLILMLVLLLPMGVALILLELITGFTIGVAQAVDWAMAYIEKARNAQAQP